MADYYGVQRSEAYLAHYGVKGMKWGVRKAVESGNAYKLDRQYRKAQKKLQKLNLKADTDIQKIYAKKHFRRAGMAGGIGLAGVGAGVANQIDIINKINAIANQRKEAIQSNAFTTSHHKRKKNVVGEGLGVSISGEGLGTGPVGNNGLVGYHHPSYHPNQTITNNVTENGSFGTLNTHLYKDQPKDGRYRTIRNLSEYAALAGLGTAAYQTGRGIAAKYRTTKKGHAKAVAKRDAWKREMDAAFKGTKYAKKHR